MDAFDVFVIKTKKIPLEIEKEKFCIGQDAFLTLIKYAHPEIQGRCSKHNKRISNIA